MIQFVGATPLPFPALDTFDRQTKTSAYGRRLIVRRNRCNQQKKKFSLGRRRTNEERLMKLLPSTIWLVDYILTPQIKAHKGAWTYFTLAHLAERKKAPSRAALQRALDQVRSMSDYFGLTIYLIWKSGRPQLVAASNEWLKWDKLPLHFWDTKRKRTRHLRAGCREIDFLEMQTHCLNRDPTPYSISSSEETAAANSETSSFPDLSSRFAPSILSPKHPKAGLRSKKLQKMCGYLVSELRRRHGGPGSGFEGRAIFGFILQLLNEGRPKHRILSSFSFHWRSTDIRPTQKTKFVTWKMRSKDFPFTRAMTTRARIGKMIEQLKQPSAAAPIMPAPETKQNLLEKFLELAHAPRSGPGMGELAAAWNLLTGEMKTTALTQLTDEGKKRMSQVRLWMKNRNFELAQAEAFAELELSPTEKEKPSLLKWFIHKVEKENLSAEELSAYWKLLPLTDRLTAQKLLTPETKRMLFQK